MEEKKMYSEEELTALMQLAANYAVIEGYAEGVKNSKKPIRDAFAFIGAVLTTMLVIGCHQIKKDKNDAEKKVET